MLNKIPIEILRTIIRSIDDSDALYQCLFVCKRWKPFAELQYYSNVYVETAEALTRLASIFEIKPHLAHAVKSVEFGLCSFEKGLLREDQVYEFLCHLPNLQYYGADCYEGLPRALEESKLPELWMIQEPVFVDDWEEYTTSTILARKNMERVLLTDSTGFLNFEEPDYTTYHSLLEVLQDFEKLAVIDIDLTIMDPIAQLESIVRKCSETLEVLNIKMSAVKLDDVFLEEDTLRENEITNLIPRPNLDKVFATFSNYKHFDKLLSYINHKFPHPKNLIIILENPVFNDEVAQQLFKCLSKNQRLSINIIERDLPELLNIISVLSHPNKSEFLECVKINYEDDIKIDPQMHLSRVPNLNDVLTVSYSTKTHGLAHMPFVETIGSKMKILDFRCPSITENPDLVLGKMFDHLLQHCTSLTKLTLLYFNFKMEDGHESIATRRILENLTVESGVAYHRGIECFLRNVSVINYLEFSRTQFYNYDESISPFVNLDLPDTHIGLLVIDLNSAGLLYKETSSRYLFFKTCTRASDGCEDKDSKVAADSYYKYDFETMDDKMFKEIDGKEYHDEEYRNYTHFELNCKSVHYVGILYNKIVVRASALSQTCKTISSLEELH